MLSDEGNVGHAVERWKAAIGLIGQKKKKGTALHVRHTFSVHFFAVVLRDYNVKLQKLLSYTFYGKNVVRVLVHFFFFSLPLIFTLHWWPLAFLTLSPPLQNFLVLPTKKCLLCFLSLDLDLCRPFSLLSLFLLFYIPICGHNNFNTFENTDIEIISALVFIRAIYTRKNKALFTRREDNPGARVNLALAYFFFFHATCLQGR